MIRKFIITTSIILAFNNLVVNSQDIISGEGIFKVCYAGNKTTKVYIPPPDEFFKKDRSKGAKISVSYSGFNSLTRRAFEYAVSILSSILTDNASFSVKAIYTSISDAGVLARASATYYARGSYINAFEPDAFYSAALAENIAGSDLSENGEPDITITINSDINWYLGTSGDTPSDQYDFVTVILHELIHGLGFFSSYYVEGDSGGYGGLKIPLIFDIFVEDENGNKLTDTTLYANPSDSLKDVLTSGKVFIYGPVQEAFNPGNRTRLYAPAKWDDGSSISHLNEATTPQADALMTPFIDKGEAIHSPGKIARSILGDIGWINSRIIHTPFTDTEEHLSQIEFKAKIFSDTLFNQDKVGLVYSFDEYNTRDTLYLNPPQTDDTFRISLSLSSYNVPLNYSFFLTDCFGRIFRFPSSKKYPSYRFFIGTDTIKPQVTHQPAKFLFDLTPEYLIEAVAVDNIGIDTVYAEYRINDSTPFYVGLKRSDNNKFFAGIKIAELSPEPGDLFNYRIIAIDKSEKHNTYILPEEDYFRVRIEESLEPSDAFETDFRNATDLFLNEGFEIVKPYGFNDEALHTRHPYESPEKDDETLEYISILRQPVLVDESGLIISFNEIVLVEPGELGSVYGSEDFYDYVIVEGSKDFGGNWFPIASGYDSRVSNEFLNAYNSSMSGINSTYIPSQSNFQPRTFDIRTFTNFKPGDTLFLRFRLFSDPYAHGWGWAVDDLKIISVSAGVESISLNNSLKLYPNPGNGIIYVNITSDNPFEKISYSISNITGTTIKAGNLPVNGTFVLNLTDQNSGIYFIKIQYKKSLSTIKYIKAE